MAKASQLLAAMDRHPGEVIIFLDVDCEVLSDLSPLAGITGDVGFYVRTKYRRSGGMRFGARSGTVVVRPTPAARLYVKGLTHADGIVCTRSAAPLFVVRVLRPGFSPSLQTTRYDLVSDPAKNVVERTMGERKRASVRKDSSRTPPSHGNGSFVTSQQRMGNQLQPGVSEHGSWTDSRYLVPSVHCNAIVPSPEAGSVSFP
jgi:hypothetical protein